MGGDFERRVGALALFAQRSVRTMQELLTPPAQRAKTFHRGSRNYDATQMGYTEEGAYVLDTTMPATPIPATTTGRIFPGRKRAN